MEEKSQPRLNIDEKFVSTYVNHIDDIKEVLLFTQKTKNQEQYGKVLVFYGRGKNGKSTLIDKIRKEFDEDEVAKLEITMLSSLSAMNKLHDKKLVIIEDDNNKDVDDFIKMQMIKILNREPICVGSSHREARLVNPMFNILVESNRFDYLSNLGVNYVEYIDFCKLL
jgi:hypothetical protein